MISVFTIASRQRYISGPQLSTSRNIIVYVSAIITVHCTRIDYAHALRIRFRCWLTNLRGIFQFGDLYRTNGAPGTLSLVPCRRNKQNARLREKKCARWRLKRRAWRSAQTQTSTKSSLRWSKARSWCASTVGKGAGQRSISTASKPTRWRYCSSSWPPGGRPRHLATRTSQVSAIKKTRCSL